MDMKICVLFLVALISSALAQNDPTTAKSPNSTTTTTPSAPTTSPPKTTTTSSPDPPKTTTTPSSTTTADPPKTTTTTPPPSTTTTPASTTTVPVTTTAKPKPKPDMIVEYNITKKGVNNTEFNCFMGKFKTDLAIKYNATHGMETGYLTLTDMSSVVQTESSCGDNKTVLVILIDNLNGDKLSLTFFNDTKTYALVNVSVFIDPKTIAEHLPNATNLDEKIDSKIVNGNLFSSPVQKSYLCKSNVSKVMDNANKDKDFEVTISMSDVQIDAFRHSENGKKFRDVQECDADDEFSDVVPIAVGAALAALVIIVLIAYFIGRRRSRQMSYQSV